MVVGTILVCTKTYCDEYATFTPGDTVTILKIDPLMAYCEVAYLSKLLAVPGYRTAISYESICSYFKPLVDSKPSCTCGAASVGHPGHAHYCDMSEGVVST